MYQVRVQIVQDERVVTAPVDLHEAKSFLDAMAFLQALIKVAGVDTWYGNPQLDALRIEPLELPAEVRAHADTILAKLGLSR